ncbi:MAG: SH3 domain-containing protein [Clostridia bacterium]|nr:SH3 domain-containing protein [Clostridia bacterium]
MEEKLFFQQGIEELDLDALENVTGGKKRPFVRSLGKGVNVRTGPGTQYPVVTTLGYLDEVPVSSKQIVKDDRGYYWAKVKVAVSQTKSVEGWVCSKYAEGCWN